MAEQANIVTIEAKTLALTEALTKQSEIPARIRGMYDMVYAWLRTSGLERVGFPVSLRFKDAPQVRCVELSSGRAAHLRHRGPYSGTVGRILGIYGD